MGAMSDSPPARPPPQHSRRPSSPSVGGPKSVAELFSESAALNARMANIGLGDWRRAIGARLSERTQPERIVDGTLTVRVPSSTWAQELSLLSHTVIERLRELGHSVERLRFNVAPTVPKRDSPVTHVGKSALPEQLQECIARVQDPELRTALGDAASYSLGRDPTRRG